MDQPKDGSQPPRLTSPRCIRQLLFEHGVRLSKALGQHFLADANILGKLVEACAVQGDEPVIEIGAGIGTLTLALAPQAGRVWAVEKDGRLIPILSEHLRDCASVEVIHADILELQLDTFGDELVLVGNLPYGITSQLLLKLIRDRSWVRRAVLMVQREVGERLVQGPGPRASRLGLHLRAYFDVDILRYVPRTAFFPPPEVDSAVLSLRPLARSRIQSRPESYEQVLKAVFGARRKTACNALSRLVRREHALQALQELGRPPSVRGEELTVEEVDALARKLLDSA